ncbi:hypothetical protein P3W45_001656 [Vairimorpha bombi]|jgi:WD40 repeat protein
MKIYKILSKTESKNTLPIFSIDTYERMLITSSTNGDVDLYKDEEVIYKSVKKHNGAVLCVRFDLCGTRIASCGDDGTVIIYDNELNVLNYFKNHTGDVTNVLWTDKYLASVGHDGFVVFYDNKDYKLIVKIKAHESKITGISSNKKNDYICTQGEDGIILYKGHVIYKKIPPKEGVILESFFSRMSWSPDGLLFSSGLSFNQKVNSVEIYNIEMENKYSLLGHVAPCEATAFNPKIFTLDKQFMILAVGSQDLSISLWTTLSPYPFLLIKNASDLPILDLKWNEEGTVLYFCSYDGTVKKLEFDLNELGNLATKECKIENSELFLSLLNAELYDSKIHNLLTQNEMTKNKLFTQNEMTKNNLHPINEMTKNNLHPINEMTKNNLHPINEMTKNNLHRNNFQVPPKSSLQNINGYMNGVYDNHLILKDLCGMIPSNQISLDHIKNNVQKAGLYHQPSQIFNNSNHNTHLTDMSLSTPEKLQKIKEMGLKSAPDIKHPNASVEETFNLPKRMISPDGWSDRPSINPPSIKKCNEVSDQIPQLSKSLLKQDTTSISDIKSTTKSVKRKTVRPVLIDDNERKDVAKEVLMFNFKQSVKIENGKIEEFYKDFGDYTIELNSDKTILSIKRAKKEFFDIYGSFNFISASKKYIAVYTTNIEVYNLKTGTLICPFIGSSSVIYMDIYKENLLFLEGDGTVSIFNIKTKNLIQTRIPKYDTVIKIKFSRVYFVICEYRDTSYILDKNTRLWYLLRKDWNDRETSNTDITNTIDESLMKLENKFLVNLINKRHSKLKRITRKMVNILLDMKLTDQLENKFKKIFIDLINLGHKKFVIKCLEKLSKNFNLQYFVVDIMKKMC